MKTRFFTTQCSRGTVSKLKRRKGKKVKLYNERVTV